MLLYETWLSIAAPASSGFVAYALHGLVPARLSCDEMAGVFVWVLARTRLPAVCECVCFALKLHLTCVGFPTLCDYITYTNHSQRPHLKQIFFPSFCAGEGTPSTGGWFTLIKKHEAYVLFQFWIRTDGQSLHFFTTDYLGKKVFKRIKKHQVEVEIFTWLKTFHCFLQ